MRLHTLRHGMLGSLGLLGALGAACAGDTRSSPTDEDYADVATSLGTTAAHDGDEVSAMRAAAALARGELPSGLARGGDGSFTGATAGLDYRYALACHTTAGAAVAPCDPTSAGADVEASWSGALDLPQLAMSIEHAARWRLTGMTGAIAHVDGTGHLAYASRDAATSYHYRYDATYHVVVDDRRAIGGEIDFAITAEHTGGATRTFAIAAQLTILPDDTGELVLDGERHYRVALATGAVTRLDGRAVSPAAARD
jgi:hypothetical protein